MDYCMCISAMLEGDSMCLNLNDRGVFLLFAVSKESLFI